MPKSSHAAFSPFRPQQTSNDPGQTLFSGRYPFFAEHPGAADLLAKARISLPPATRDRRCAAKFDSSLLPVPNLQLSVYEDSRSRTI